MITLRQRIIKISSWDKDLLLDLLRDTHDQSLDYEWLRFNKPFSFTNTRKPWAGKVNVDKTQFKIIRLAARFFGNDRSSVIVYGKVIVINHEQWLKLTYKPFRHVAAGFVAFLLVFAYFQLRFPPRNAMDGLFSAAIVIIPLVGFYWDLYRSDKKMLKYIHQSRTKVYEAALASNTKEPQYT